MTGRPDTALPADRTGSGAGMRVLYYNWVDYLDDEARGGGVSVYQHNLLRALDDRPGVQADFLSSGLSHDLRGGAPRWDRIRHGPETDRARRYEIVNSATLSPSHHSFGNPAQISDPATEAAVMAFIAANGPYDVVHFNNLEGLPARVLALKRRWPQTRVILTLHNYYPFCPQVNLWWDERETCTDFGDGAACVSCLPHKPPEPLVRLANALAYRLKCAGIRPGTRSFDLAFRTAIRIGSRAARLAGMVRARRAPEAPTPLPDQAAGFAGRRAEMVTLINTCCDRVLCVSERVRDLAVHHGIRADLAQTSYIGTAEAACFDRTTPHDSVLNADGTLTLAYLGYMRRDKGFFFLLDALETLPDALVARLRLKVAARTGAPQDMARLTALRARLAGLTHVDGYTHDGLDDLLDDVGVGLVPVLWQDNLPQVAIEMHARHIPLLTSDLGGAQELAGHGEMVFRAGDIADFGTRLRHVLDGDLDVGRYWANARAPVSMPAHMAALMQHYSPESASG